MPIYEYRCEDCGTQFEELTLSRNDAKVSCQKCSGQRVTRLLSTFAVGAESAPAPAEASPCGACSASQRGMCGVE